MFSDLMLCRRDEKLLLLQSYLQKRDAVTVVALQHFLQRNPYLVHEWLPRIFDNNDNNNATSHGHRGSSLHALVTAKTLWESPLILACRQQPPCWPVVQILLQHGATVHGGGSAASGTSSSSSSLLKETALHVAVQAASATLQQHQRQQQRRSQHHHQPDASSSNSSSNNNMIEDDSAVITEALSVVRGLLAAPGTNVNVRDANHETPLFRVGNCIPLLELLVGQYQANVHAVNDQGYTFLHVASAARHAPAVAWILQHCGGGSSGDPQARAQPNVVCRATGATPLLYAIQYPYLRRDADLYRVVRSLLEAGADPNQTDHHGRVPLYEALVRYYRDVVELLLQYGASTAPVTGPSTSTLASKSSSSSSPSQTNVLYTAICMNDTKLIRLLLQHSTLETVNAFCDDTGLEMHGNGYNDCSGARNTNRTVTKTTPLLQAIRMGHVPVVTLLLEHGANASLPSPWEPLAAAGQRYGDVNMLYTLIRSNPALYIEMVRGPIDE